MPAARIYNASGIGGLRPSVVGAHVVATKRKSWREKLHDNPELPKVEKISADKRQSWGKGTFVVPSPLEVDAVMRKVRKGKLLTISEIRTHLAAKHKATICCPLTAGIFAWIAAHAANEDETAGAKRITPYWRTLKSGGELNPKYPGGIAELTVRLQAEGHRVIQRGNRAFVEGYERCLAKI